MYNGEFYFEDKNFKLIKEDIFKALKNFQEKSFDMIFADPPYFLSNNGITCSSGKMVCVNKGEWDKPSDVESKHSFNRKWINECYRVLRKRGELYFTSSFGIDKIAVEATLLPMLKKQKIYFSLSQTKNFIIVQIGA